MQLSLSAALDKRKLSIDALAEKSGINKSTINRLKRGEIRPMHDTVVVLERALALKPGTLVFPRADSQAIA